MLRFMTALVALTVALSAPPARASVWEDLAELNPNLKAGSLEFHPYYGIKGTYHDNIYKVNRDKADGTRHGCLSNSSNACSGGVRGSWFVTNNVGFNATLPFGGRHALGAGYDLSTNNYRIQTRANDSVSQSVKGQYDFKGELFTARVWDNFTNTEDPPYNPQAPVLAPKVGGELVARERRSQNTVGGELERALGDKYFVAGTAQSARDKYVNPALARLLDRSEQRYGFRTGYKIMPKTRLYIGGQRGLTHYSAGRKGANHKDWNADAGVEGELTAKIKGRFSAGYSLARYDDDNQNLSPSNKSGVWTLGLGLGYKVLPRTSVDLSASRLRQEATAVRYYVSNNVSLGVTQSIDKLTVAASGGFTQDKYSDPQAVPVLFGLNVLNGQRRDDTYTAGVSLGYSLFRWLALTADYRHTLRHSTIPELYNYADNMSSFGLRAQF